MKLVDLLIKHNVQWPVGATAVWQGASYCLYWRRNNRDAFAGHQLTELSDRNGHAYRCTKEQYDAALAKHKDKWVRNRGANKCPILPDRAFQVRLRDGIVITSTGEDDDAANCRWTHMKMNADIMAWRYV